jgi:hypothetical protein
MSFNPPDLKYEMKDTLFCLGVPYEYQRLNTPKGHVWSFFLPETKSDLDIYGPRFIRFNKKVYRSMYEAKRAVMEKFHDHI